MDLKNKRKFENQIIDLEIEIFKGNHYEMGFQQGKAFKDFIHKGLKVIQNQDAFKSMKPKFFPTNIFWKIARKKASNWLKPYIEKHAQNQADRVLGIANGADLDEKWIYLLMSTELIMDTADYEIPLEHCTDIGIKSERSLYDEPIIARNFDYNGFIVPFLRIRKNMPNGLYSSIDITATPLPGTFNGINEKGVFIGTNECQTVEPRKDGLPASILVVDLMREKPRGSTNAWLVADENNDIRVLEYTSNVVCERFPETGSNKGWIIQTNHYHVPEIKKVEVPLNAVIGKKAPIVRQGVPLGYSSIKRFNQSEKM